MAGLVLALVALPLQAQSNRSPVPARHGMVVSDHVLASEVGRDVLQQGGNAVVNIESFYDRNARASTSEYECHAGALMAGVARPKSHTLEQVLGADDRQSLEDWLLRAVMLTL